MPAIRMFAGMARSYITQYSQQQHRQTGGGRQEKLF
jgi:hypothetical protein